MKLYFTVDHFQKTILLYFFYTKCFNMYMRHYLIKYMQNCQYFQISTCDEHWRNPVSK